MAAVTVTTDSGYTNSGRRSRIFFIAFSKPPTERFQCLKIARFAIATVRPQAKFSTQTDRATQESVRRRGAVTDLGSGPRTTFQTVSPHLLALRISFRAIPKLTRE